MPKSTFTRREFAQRAALASAATLLPAELPAQVSPNEALVNKAAPIAQIAPDPKLSPPSQVEADLRTQAVLSRYGGRLSESQRREIAKLSAATQQQLDRIREFATGNADDPALYLKPLVERERKSLLNPPVPKSTGPAAGLVPPAKKS